MGSGINGADQPEKLNITKWYSFGRLSVMCEKLSYSPSKAISPEKYGLFRNYL
jgi:hypothetical protein